MSSCPGLEQQKFFLNGRVSEPAEDAESGVAGRRAEELGLLRTTFIPSLLCLTPLKEGILSDFDSDCPIHLNFICSNTIISFPTICGLSRISGFNTTVT